MNIYEDIYRCSNIHKNSGYEIPQHFNSVHVKHPPKVQNPAIHAKTPSPVIKKFYCAEVRAKFIETIILKGTEIQHKETSKLVKEPHKRTSYLRQKASKTTKMSI
jgi:hypothetical protein